MPAIYLWTGFHDSAKLRLRGGYYSPIIGLRVKYAQGHSTFSWTLNYRVVMWFTTTGDQIDA